MHVTGIIKAKGLSIVLLNINKKHGEVLFLLFIFKRATWKNGLEKLSHWITALAFL